MSNKELNIIQKKALLHATKKAKLCHNNCEHLLKNRILTKNLDADIYDKLQEYMQNHVPMITHFNAAILLKLGSANYLKNAFETNSKGSAYLISRNEWERNLFGSIYDDAEPSERPKYCSLNLVMNPKGGNNDLRHYGKSFMVYKHHVRERTTFVFGDTCLKDFHNATLKYCNHILHYLSDEVFDTMVKIVIGTITESSVDYKPYIDCQIHGSVSINQDIESIFIDMTEKITENEIDEFIIMHPEIEINLINN